MSITRLNNNLSSASTSALNRSIEPNLLNALENLASGQSLNRAAEDAAGFSNASRLQVQITSLNEAYNAAQTGINLSNVADSGLNAVQERLQRMRELILKAGNTGIANQQTLSSLQSEIKQNIDEIGQITENTQFNTNPLLNGNNRTTGTDRSETGQEANLEGNNSAPSYNIQLGSEAGQGLTISFGDTRPQSLGKGSNQTLQDIDVTQPGGTDQALGIVDQALEQVSSMRRETGAFSNRLEASANALSVESENLTASRSQLTDTNYAAEATRLAHNELQLKVNLAMQSQANQLQNGLLLELVR